MQKYLIFILLILLISCNNNTSNKKNHKIAALINDSVIIPATIIDSMITNQIYELRLQTLEFISSKYILEYEAKRRNLSLNELVEIEINNKADKININDINKYKENISDVEVSDKNIQTYLISQNRMKRQEFFVDSLKKVLNYKVKLKPDNFSKIETTDSLSYFNINYTNTTKEVYIISDFKCYSCKNAENELKKIITKYNNKIKFKFVYFSDYIQPKLYVACNIANNNNKFDKVKNIFFEHFNTKNNSELISFLPTVIIKELNNLKKNDINIMMKKAINTKKYLINNGIFSTPTFIVNNKIIEGKYAVNYLEDVIIEEYKLNN